MPTLSMRLNSGTSRVPRVRVRVRVRARRGYLGFRIRSVRQVWRETSHGDVSMYESA